MQKTRQRTVAAGFLHPFLPAASTNFFYLFAVVGKLCLVFPEAFDVLKVIPSRRRSFTGPPRRGLLR
jgi:hypothetical protein